jgi:putative ABC transport system permease protein
VNTLVLAWRNLQRNRRRSLTTLLAMILGVVAVLLFAGYVGDITYQLQTDYVKRTGHLQIQHQGYFLYGSGDPAAYGIGDYESVMATVKNDPVLAPMLAVVTPTLQFGGIAGNFSAGVSRTIYGVGMVVEDQNRMREWNDYDVRVLRTRKKDLPLSGTASDAAVIGTGVARVLQLCAALGVQNCAEPAKAGDASTGVALPDDIAALSVPGPLGEAPRPNMAGPRVELLAASSHGAPNISTVNVVSAEYQGIKELDDIYVALHLTQAQKLIFGGEAPRVTAIELQLQHTSQMPQAKARLAQLLSTTLKDRALEILDFETLNPFYGQTLSMFGAILGFIAVLIGAVVLFTISNTMSMTVVERTVEIGTLRAIGLRRGGIRAMFLVEAVMLGVVGSCLGVVSALGLSWAFNELGLTWTPPGRIELVPLAVRLAPEHGMMLASGVGLVIVAALSAILPAARASRMNIVDALRHV